MPEKETRRKANAARRAGKAPSTQAGAFVREEMHHLREGKRGATSRRQAVAIGLSKARRAGVPLPPPNEDDRGEKPRKRRKSARKRSAKRKRQTSKAKNKRPTNKKRKAKGNAKGSPSKRRSAKEGARRP